jgi:hypothetical protein
MGGRAISQQSYRNNGVKAERTCNTTGPNSAYFKSREESDINGNKSIRTDMGSKDITQADRMNVNRSNNMSETSGNDSVYTNELNEGAFGSRARMIGNPAVVNNKLHQDADMLKGELVAARSGFNDNRNDVSGGVLSSLAGIPKKVLEAIVDVKDDVAEGDDEPLSSNGGNLFLAMATDVMNEVSNYTKKFSKMASSAQLKKAALVAQNEFEKVQKQAELVYNKLPECPTKETLKKAIAEGNLSILLSNPSSESKDKKSTYNKDEYEKKAAELTPKIMELERQNC